ncbi:hypothetical protein FHS43_000581 [Streptosporangium becharense]|uniref:Uncharacterized protein n=1 Tax=Streptosporangium becharense TaxID=1816182 RepID=A0A7W9IN21_9ACTN|nr:hypothetical protein [Streptosporangium becharense]MBB2909335.1 hypothetical protein [Streptosporangium becharense]MBB5823762.1 hypothetical protein [Streptosporangium becharense]
MTEPFPPPPVGGAAVRPEDGAQDDWAELMIEDEASDDDEG